MLVLCTDDTHGLTGALACAGVGLRALPTDGKSAAVAEATVAIDGLQALEIALKLASKVSLDDDLLGGNRGNDGTDLLGRKFLGPRVGVDVGLFKDAAGGLRADAVNVNERGFDALVAGDFYAEESWHGMGWFVVVPGVEISPGAVCDAGSCRPRAPRCCGGRSCRFRKGV